MTVLALRAFKDNYIWVLPDQTTGVFDCVDPGESTPVIDYAKRTGLALRNILLTHHHFDHIDGVAKLIDQFPDVKVYAPNDSRIPYVNKILSKDESVKSGQYEFHVLDTPGHTSTHISYLEKKKQWLFCGDTLFSAGCGRVFDGTMQELYKSLCLFKELNESTLVYCAHEYTEDNLKFGLTIEPQNTCIQDYLQAIEKNKPQCTLPSTIKHEKKMNPFLRTDKKEIKAYAEKHGVNPSDPLAIFSFLRQKKDLFRAP